MTSDDVAPGVVRFTISAGRLDSVDHGGSAQGLGSAYSGNGPFMNNPDFTSVHKHGPLPVGTYTIGAPENRPQSVGQFALPLLPAPDNQMLGRSGFWIHGDNPAGDHTASDGCIVTSRVIRQICATYHTLEVVP